MLYKWKKNDKVGVCTPTDSRFKEVGKVKDIREKSGFRGYKYNIFSIEFKDKEVVDFHGWELTSNKD